MSNAPKCSTCTKIQGKKNFASFPKKLLTNFIKNDTIKKNKERRIKMDAAIIILGILYLLDFNVGLPLAICSIIEGFLVIILTIMRQHEKDEENLFKKI